AAFMLPVAAAIALVLSAEPTRPAAPPPAGAHEPTKAELKRFRAAVAEGTKAERKGDHGRAVAAFERALAIRPEHARVLSDLGWAAFQMHDLDRAERTIRKAIDVVGSNPPIEAAAQYN